MFYFTRKHIWNWNKIISTAEGVYNYFNIISVTMNMLESVHELQ